MTDDADLELGSFSVLQYQVSSTSEHLSASAAADTIHDVLHKKGGRSGVALRRTGFRLCMRRIVVDSSLKSVRFLGPRISLSYASGRISQVISSSRPVI